MPSNRFKYYKKPPIVEAVIDFQVELPEGVGINELDLFSSRLASELPKKELLHETVFTGTYVEGSAAHTTSNTQVGYRLTTEDQKWSLQVRLNHFTLSQLQSYESWDSFRGRARAYWGYFREQVKPSKIARAGVRYINRIDIPREENLSRYLRIGPGIPIGVRDEIGDAFFMQLRGCQTNPDSSSIINVGSVQAPDPDTSSYIFDIDLFREDDWSGEDESVWLFLDKIRDRKNKIFESCITPALRQTFK